MKNSMEIKFKAIAQNVAFARNVAASFVLPLNPSLDEISDLKTSINEAVTNVVVHAYPNQTGYVTMKIVTQNNTIAISISDNGVGIPDIERALTPFYTSKPNEERSGMGFTVMESFMNKLEVCNNKGAGITVKMIKVIEQQINKTNMAVGL